MKVAIVGIGHVARYQMDAIRQLAGVELVGVYDGDMAAVNRHAVSCRVHGSLDDLIENSSADVVVISTSNSGERPEIISLQNGLPRLTNHYVVSSRT
jgi:predicted dehydrogenase